MATVKIDGSNFQSDVLGSSEPVVVDFWAEWCGPCKMIAPALEEISTEMEGKVKIAKVNVDENQDLAVQFGVRSIPMLLMFKNGEIADQMIGAAPKARLMDWIKSATA
ncbi:thioredoxin [Oricola nitratireducens]|jgi:thioredoxin 1|uniref:thioredoxin n=1 Tax=Oricola nitratireducens TaxID=2775868 RepID=UPI001866487C|nr:thioredoxin [Oricola nitratireducens]